MYWILTLRSWPLISWHQQALMLCLIHGNRFLMTHCCYNACFLHILRGASHYTILSLRRPAMAPHDADVVMSSCNVRPSMMPSVTILYIRGNLR